MNDASIRDFAAKLEAAAAAAAPGSSSRVELCSAVKERQFEALSATVNALSACPHNVSCELQLHTLMLSRVLIAYEQLALRRKYAVTSDVT
jgi:hypothetical protein